MKKIIYIGLFAMMAFSMNSCDHEHEYPGVDEASRPTNVVNLKLDYDGAYPSGGAFSETSPASDIIPDWLKKTYYTVDNGSTAKVSYLFAPTVPEYVTVFSNAKSYTVTSDDYKTVWGDDYTNSDYFTSSKPAASFLPGILSNAVTESVEKDLAVVKYTYAEVQIPDELPQEIYVENFNGAGAYQATLSLEGWLNISVIDGATKWWANGYYDKDNDGYPTISAFKYAKGDMDVYLVSPEVTITKGLVLTFDHAFRNFVDKDCFKVYIIQDLNGKDAAAIKAATKDDITTKFNYAIPEVGASNNRANVGEYKLDAYAGKKIRVAFEYYGAATGNTTTVQLDNMIIREAGQGIIISNKSDVNTVYQYDGTTWKPYNEALVLQPADYEDMGVAGLTATNWSHYLPIFLSKKYPYAEGGTKYTLVFTNAEGKVMAQELMLKGGSWVSTTAVETQTGEYEYKDGAWTFSRIMPNYIFNESFEETQGDFTIVDVTLDPALTYVWKQDSKYKYIKASAYKSGNKNAESWLISPTIDMSEVTDAALSFEHAQRYFAKPEEEQTLWVSTSYDGGEIVTDAWKQIEIPVYSDGSDWTFVKVEKISLKEYVGQKNVRIAFKYKSSSEAASTWEIKNIIVE